MLAYNMLIQRAYEMWLRLSWITSLKCLAYVIVLTHTNTHTITERWTEQMLWSYVMIAVLAQCRGLFSNNYTNTRLTFREQVNDDKTSEKRAESNEMWDERILFSLHLINVWSFFMWNLGNDLFQQCRWNERFQKLYDNGNVQWKTTL